MAALRRLARPREADERCELCSAPLPADHRHLFDERTEALACACQACSLLFTGRAQARYRPVPTRVLSLPDLVLSAEHWESLDVPVGLAFFARSSRLGRVVARYPSPAGPTESQLRLDTWTELEAANPALRDLQPDVEALLVNRVGAAADNLVVPIDQCYALVGLVRTGWRGLSGGPEVWGAVAAFFADLRARADVVRDA
ncbi:MAG TPA: DUF5947 family protein [Terriglobales bacterium]|nr:DUF5947 family protein [Terriglobales bacterium]